MSTDKVHDHESTGVGQPRQPNPADRASLFRPEALAARQQRAYGDILLVRPLALSVLVALVILVAFALISFLLLGHYNERASLLGTVLPEVLTEERAPSGFHVEISLYVPKRLLNHAQPGTRVPLRSMGCADQSGRSTAVIEGISVAAFIPAEVFAQANVTVEQPMYRLTAVLFPDDIAASKTDCFQPGMKVEADLPLGRKPLMQWMINGSGS
jgi:hypothetical protein